MLIKIYQKSEMYPEGGKMSELMEKLEVKVKSDVL